MRVLRLWLIALLPAAANCATVGMMRGLPPDAGQLAQYAASADTLTAAAEVAVHQLGLAVAEVTRPDARTRVVIAQKPPGLFSYGEYVRLRIARDTGELTVVRVVTKPGYLLELGHRERAPRMFQAMDAQLGAQAIGPWPGMRVRATPRGSPPFIGNVVRVTRDTIALQLSPGSASQPLAIGNLGRLAVSRGGYSHASEGMVIGFVVGGLVGAVVGSSQQDNGWTQLNGVAGFAIGMSVGALVGGVVGLSTRTEVWSELPARRHP